VDLYIHSPNAPSWHGAQLKKKDKDNFTFNFTFTFNFNFNFEVHSRIVLD